MNNFPNEDECEAAGISYDVVRKLLSRQERLLRDTDAAGVSLFCGSVNSLHPTSGDRMLILATFGASNTDGGCGAITEGDDGLMRGED